MIVFLQALNRSFHLPDLKLRETNIEMMPCSQWLSAWTEKNSNSWAYLTTMKWLQLINVNHVQRNEIAILTKLNATNQNKK